MKIKLTPLKAVLLGGILAGCVMVGIGAGLTKFVGQFYGNGAGLTNVVGSTTISGVTITNGVFQWPLDGINEDALVVHDTHGIDLDYRKIDGSGSTALFRTVDGAFHFTIPPYLDGAGFLGQALGVDPVSGAITPISLAVPINNFYVTNLFSYTNFVDNITSYYSNSVTINTNTYITQNLTVNSNLTVNQNISVSGKATLTTVIITNSVLYSTNAFPLAAGTTWDWSRFYQRIITNASFNITAIGGLSNNLLNVAMLQVSNSAAGNITVGLTFSMTPFGPLSTNSIVLTSGQQAEIDGNCPGINLSTNIATIVSH